MSVIGITGARGLLGWHLRCALHASGSWAVRVAGRQTFGEPGALDQFVRGCDVVVHFAGANRGPELQIEQTNVELARALVAACERADERPHVVFAGSTHEGRDDAYGRSKEWAGEWLRAWADREQAILTHLVMPHVFGEMGRPYYNSVVSTFCHQLAEGEPLTVNGDSGLELVHAQDVAATVVDAVERGLDGRLRVPGEAITVRELESKLQSMAKEYRDHRIPDLGGALDLHLFNTLRSYFYPSQYPAVLPTRADGRGTLVEAVKTTNGGQTFLSSTKPGVTRGNHFHLRKVERFLVVRGEAVIRIRRLFSDELTAYPVSGAEPAYVDIPTLHTHNITNTADGELLTLFWAHEIFDPEAPDTTPEAV